MKKHNAIKTPCLSSYNAKVGKSPQSSKDIVRVYDFFRYTTGTTLDCAKETGILRNSITWYVAELEKGGLLQVVALRYDATTHRIAKHYSADRSKWTHKPQQLTLFGEEAQYG